jgi:RNA polymerase sigma-70 factor (ECF subfamily)
VDERDWLAGRFEDHRGHLRAVAYRMLGSISEADDVVQEAWLRLARAETGDVANLRGWLTTVVARLCLDALRARRARREDLAGFELPEPIVGSPTAPDPEQQILLADSVGLAMLVVLEQLSPPERLAFVLHDVFAMPFEAIAPIVDRSPPATRQLASRARRKVRGSAPRPDADLARQHEVVDAFVRASQAGDFDALLAILDPDVIVRADFGPTRPELNTVVRGARAVAGQAVLFRNLAPSARRATVNGGAGAVVFAGDRRYAVIGFTVQDGRIVEMDILGDPVRLAALDLRSLDA